MGTGPYVVTKFNRGAGTYSLERNENYWGAAPEVDNVEVRFLPEESGRVIALRSGEVDIIDSITPDSREQLAGLPGVVTRRGLQPAAEPDLLQLPQARRPPAGRRPGP